MYGWHGGVALEKIAKMVHLPSSKIKQLFTAFEKVKTYCISKPEVDIKELKQLSGLSESNINAILVLLQKQ